MTTDQYKFIIDNVNDIIFQTDNNGKWTFLSKSWERAMKFTVEDSLYTPLFNYLHPADVKKSYLLFAPLMDGRRQYCSHEIRYIAKTGDTIWMRVYAVLLKDADGTIIGTSGTLCDISKEKQSREMIELLSTNISDIISVHELDGTYKYISPSVLAITGYTEQELLGKTLFDFVFSEDLLMFKNQHMDLIKNEGSDSHIATFRFVTKSGRYIWLEAVPKPIINDLGDVVGLVTSSRAVDVRKKAEEQLIISYQKERELNQLKSSFINMASHEFRTPLAIMHSSLELVELSINSHSKNVKAIDKHINNIYSEIDRLNSLIDDVLITGKIDSNTIVCHNEIFSVTELVKAAISAIEGTQTDNRQVELTIEGEQRDMLADPDLMRQVLYNLLSNAFKYSAGNKEPQLVLKFANKEIIIKIKDYGIGIPDSDNKKIFSAFFRASNAGQVKGNGLGMFITKKFVEIQNGQISFQSSKDQGTEFLIVFRQ